MKKSALILGMLGCMILAACTGNSSTPPTMPSVASPPSINGKAPLDPKAGQQIPAQEVLGSKTERILRYQPADEIKEYLNDPKEFDLFISKVSGALRRNVGNLTPEKPTYGTVVFGLNSNGEHRIWYVFPESKPSEAFKEAMEAAVLEAPKPVVKKELVTFGIAIALWGFKESHEQAGRIILPQEWQDAGKAFSQPQKATKLATLAWNKHDA